MATIYDIAIPFIARWEGLKLTPYYCSAWVLTIGYGEVIKADKMYGEQSGRFLISDCSKYRKTRSLKQANDAIKKRFGNIITQEQAEADFNTSLKRTYWYNIREFLPQGLTDNQCASLLSFAYNCGVNALRHSTLLKKLNAGDIHGASNEFLRWNRAGGRVVRGLTRRRQSERALFLKNEGSQ